MPIIPTRVYDLNITAYLDKKRRALNEGGTTSSKTYSIMAILCDIARSSKQHKIISVVSESLPHLKRGCIRDFIKIMGDEFSDNNWNKTEHIYTFPNAIIEFFPADDSTKLRGGRRDILYINECNNVHYDSYRELDIRTSRFTFLDWNPTCEFWVHENNLQNEPGNVFIHSTYLDVKNILPELESADPIAAQTMRAVIENIESNKDKDPNWWRVYGLGLVGKIDGLIHPNFTTVKEWPLHGNEEGYGLDFGFNEPAALVRCKLLNEYLVCDELIYETGLTNSDLDKRFTALGIIKGRSEIIADCAEPKSIEELHRMGWNIKPAIKGSDSVVAGIQKVNQYKQVWTERSTNGIKEQRNYMWMRDKNSKILDCPSNNGYDHLLDARRYYIASKKLGPAPGQALRIAI